MGRLFESTAKEIDAPLKQREQASKRDIEKTGVIRLENSTLALAYQPNLRIKHPAHEAHLAITLAPTGLCRSD